MLPGYGTYYLTTSTCGLYIITMRSGTDPVLIATGTTLICVEKMNPGRKPGNQVNKKIVPQKYPPNEIKKAYHTVDTRLIKFTISKNFLQVHTVPPMV